MANQDRERDLVLAPNEYAYISDQTKGHIVAYVGPFKTSMANTDKPVYFDANEKRFNICSLEHSIKTFTTVPENWYAALKNPPKDGSQPATGTANNLPNLNVGRKVNIPGPAFFALWPGQMVKVIQGHRLRSNEYLVVRVYEEEQATQNWKNAIIQPQNDIKTPKEGDTKEVVPDSEIPNLAVGKLLVIKGSNVSFYIPPTGIEVVPDVYGNYVRKAVTLERLEYCILLDEDGNKRYITGPDVVIPNPTETFFVKNGQRKFKAIELSDVSGIYVKVIAPYTEKGKEYEVGEELFITGNEQMIYYPRPEHALIKYGDHEIYQAVAIPAGEGRYYLNRKSGQIMLKKGPCMFLPDPREAVIVQRILTPKQASLWYPGNVEVMEFNEHLNNVAAKEKAENFLTRQQIAQYASVKGDLANEEELMAGVTGDEFVREQSYTSARTITLDTKFAGAVTVEVWTGYAILVTGKSGTRKVIVGPQTYLLEYDESLGVMELSTGTPKMDDNTINTVYLRVLHNKVSDIIEVETKDLCPVEISLSYRVNFTDEPEKWFNVENYVKFLTDHMRSVVRNAIKKLSVTEFYARGIDILRDVILGPSDEKGVRKYRLFNENGMQIYDVEILDIKLDDDDIEDLLFSAQHEEVRQKLDIESKKNEFEFTKQIEAYVRNIAIEKSVTKQKAIELQMQEVEKQLLYNLAKLETDIKTQQKTLDGKLEEQQKLIEINDSRLQQEKASKELQLEIAQKTINQEIMKIKAEVEAVVNKAKAVSPDLIAALQSFSDRALAERMAETMAPLSILGGKSIAEVFSNMLKGTALENVLKNPVSSEALVPPTTKRKPKKPSE